MFAEKIFSAKLEAMLNLILSIMLTILTASSIAHASEAAYEKHMTKGIMAIEDAQYLRAVEQFRAALLEKPDDIHATLYLGIVLSRLGDRDAGATLKKALAMNPKDPRTNLEIGIYYFRIGNYYEARDYFEQAINLSPGTEISAKAEEYIGLIAKGEKPWRLSISGGGQYDSNVVLNADGAPLPEGISRKSDWRGVIYLSGRYDLIKNASGEGSIGYALYQSFHRKLSDFDITQHLIDVKGKYNFSPFISLRGYYSYEYIYAGGDDYSYANSISPSLVISEGDGFYTIIEYRYRKSNFMDTDLFKTNSERTGENNFVGITQGVALHSSIMARAGYSHDEDSTKKDYWDYKGDRGFIDIKFRLPLNVFLDMYGEYYWKGYEGTHPGFGLKRNDNIRLYSISATKGFADRYSITLGYTRMDSNSNIDLFTYTRDITSIFLDARF